MKTFTVEITPTVAADGSTSTFLFSKIPWTTKPTDTPANTRVRGLLKQAGSLKRELFKNGNFTGAVQPSYGNVVFANPCDSIDSEGALDDFANYAISGALVVCRWGDPDVGTYPDDWDIAYIAYGHTMIADLSEIRIILRDRLQLLDQPAAPDTFMGTGGLEGTVATGKRKQLVIGDPGFIPPVLIDPVKQIYYLQSSGTGGLHVVGAATFSFSVYDNGIELTRGTDYSSAAQLLATSPDEGEVRFWFGETSEFYSGYKNGPVYLRLGSPPEGDVRCYAHGYPNDTDFNNWGSVIGSFNSHLAALRCGVPFSDLEGYGFSMGGFLVDDESTWLDVLNQYCILTTSFFGFTRLNKFRGDTLNDPESNSFYYATSQSQQNLPTTSRYTFTLQNVKELKREPIPGLEAPVWKISVASGKTWPSQLANGASSTIKDYLTRQPFWFSFSAVSTSALLANPGAITKEIQIIPNLIRTNFFAKILAERFFVLFGGRREFYSFHVEMDSDVLDLELGEVVTLQLPRFNLSAGKKYRIASITIDCDDPGGPKIRFVLWGGEYGQMTGFNGGPGSVPSGPAGPARPFVNPTINQYSIGNFSGFAYGYTTVTGGSSDGEEEAEQTDPNSGGLIGGSTETSVLVSKNSIGLFTGQAIGTFREDGYWSNVILLLHMDSSFVDSSSVGRTVTANGNAQISSTDAKYGAGCGLFDGTGDFLSIADAADLNFGSQEWTIEGYFRKANNNTAILLYKGVGTGYYSVQIYFDSGAIKFRCFNTDLVSLTMLTGFNGSLNTWYHFAITRDNDHPSTAYIRLYIDGEHKEVLGIGVNTVFYNDTASLIIGAYSTGTFGVNGRLDELRITMGVARYKGSGSFTPPSAPFPNG